MKTYRSDELKRFLLALDEELAESAAVIVIGGAAAAVGYGATRATKDIDTWKLPDPAVMAAAGRAAARTGLDVPFGPAGVAEGPDGMEGRFEQLKWKELKRLRVWLPERHDLTLMKMVRGYRHDVDAIAQMHKHEPLDLDILVQRFEDEVVKIVTRRPEDLKIDFLVMVERLFGRATAGKTASRLGADSANLL